MEVHITGFEYVPTTYATYSLAFEITGSPMLRVYCDDISTNTQGPVRLEPSIGSGELQLRSGAAGGSGNRTKRASLFQPLHLLTDDPYSRVIVGGCRFRQPNWLSTSSSVAMDHYLSLYSSASVNQKLLLSAHHPQAINGPEFYLEWKLDMPNRRAYVWIDGVLTVDVPIQANLLQSGNPLWVLIGNGLGQTMVTSASCFLGVRDFYTLIGDPGEEVSRLGPQVLVPIQVEQVDVTGAWNLVGGLSLSRKDFLNRTHATVADRHNNYLDGGTNFDEMKLSLATNISDLNPANAIQLDYIGKRLNGTEGMFQVQAQSSDGGSPITLQHSLGLSPDDGKKVLSAFKNSPFGGPLTDAQIEKLSVTFKPVLG